jgi:GTPase SAR1 family protein
MHREDQQDPCLTKPTVILVIGMAGSGKTTFVQRVNAHMHNHRIPDFLINLDPAVLHMPFTANIDIRDTVNYKHVMEQYHLGPNGGILTSLNIFATKFEQVLTLCEKLRDPKPQYIIVDTPGQIEIFTWSASGAVITEAFASSFPTVLAFLIDTPRLQNAQNFMSNMLQACSILYKTRLPIVVVFNKCDVLDHQFAVEWMQDFDKFFEALSEEETYAATLSRSLTLVLDEFYRNLAHIGISALTGLNIDGFFRATNVAREEYFNYYFPDLEAKRNSNMAIEKDKRQVELRQLEKKPIGSQGKNDTRSQD